MLSNSFKKKKIAYILIFPSVLVIICVTIFPLLYSSYMSLTEYSLNLGKPPTFIGLKNYLNALSDSRLLNSAITTLKIGAPALILEIIFGMLLALLLNSMKFKLRGLILALLVTPVMIAPSAAALAFRLLYSPQYGPINDILSRITGRTVLIDWLGSIKLVSSSVMLVDVWQMTPFVMLVLLAGISAISPELYEAGKIDGGTSFDLFRYITMPLLKPVLIVVVLFRTIDILKLFDVVFVLTMGGPASSSETISFYTYFVALRFLRIGYGAALSFIILFGIAILIIILNKAFKGKEGA